MLRTYLSQTIAIIIVFRCKFQRSIKNPNSRMKMPVILIKNLVDRLVISFRREECDISLRLNEFRKRPNYVTIKNAIHLLCVKKLRQDS